MQGKVITGVFTQYRRRVSRVRVSVKIRVRFRFICVGDPMCISPRMAFQGYASGRPRANQN